MVDNMHSRWLIWLSLLPAMILAVMSLPHMWAYARPAWLLLFVIFWILSAPKTVGLCYAWIGGFVLDILTGVLLGQHALAMLLTAFAAICLQKRIVRAKLMEQLLLLAPLILLYQVTYLWVGAAFGQIHPDFSYLLPVITSLPLWPLVSYVLRKINQFYTDQ